MPLNLVRRLVSGQKKRFQDGGFDLDLAYIAPRVIAMGLPAQGKEVLYRNPMQEISRFLHTYHSRHAKVYNLCSEHSYSAAHLQHPVALQQYPYDDHQTPPLAMVQQFCIDAAAWLAADPANVVVVHCKAGKGRTGIMICCLLLYLHKNAPDLANLPQPGDSAASPAAPTAGADLTGQQPHTQQQQQGKAFSSRLWHPWQSVPPVELQQLERPVQDVLDLYAERRTHDSNGVTIKSQRRYVGYFWAVLCSGPGPVGTLPSPVSVQLRQVTISGLPAGTADSCVLVVEARPSGSLAPRASRVCARSAPGALSGSLTGLCMVPCAHVPLVQEDSCCSISNTPHGDTLTFRMPAASMGLSPLLQHSSSTATRTASTAAGAQEARASQHQGAADRTDVSTVGMHGCCVCFGAPAASSCACSTHPEALPGAVPIAQPAAAGVLDTAAGRPTAAGRADSTSSSCAGGLADDSCWDASEQAGCCVVEGDVRLVVLKGTTRLFYTWFNTAWLPTGGCYTLTRSQLDKPSKSLPVDVTLTVRYVDMQPTATEAAEGGQQQQHQQGLDGQQEQKQAHSKPWLHSFQEPPLETSRKGGKGPAQQRPAGRANKQQGAGNGMLAHAGVSTGGSTDVSTQPAAVPGAQQQQQQQQRVGEGCAQPVPVSSSAPASPQDRRLQGSGSWRQHLPAISSISTSALLWGAPAPSSGGGQQRVPSAGSNKPDSWPGSWCGSAGLSWDWDTLAAADDGVGWSAGSGDGRSAAAAAASGGPFAREASQPGGRSSSTGHSQAGSAGAAAASQQQPWRRALLPGRERASSSSGGSSKGARISQDLHSSTASGSSRVVPALLPSQSSIELPVIVKRPSGVDSLVDALLDPEHSASSQSALSAAAAAAAAASGKLLASEASSSAVAAAAGAKPPAQLRKGYSWHGASSGSWFSAAAAAGSRGGSSRRSSNSSSCSHTEARTPHQQQQQEYLYADVPAPAALEASVLDLDPLLLSERSGEVPGSVLSSFDPLQGLLEALNWGTDVQRYQPRHQQPYSSARSSAHSSSSEPSSPRRGARPLPTVLSSPQLQPTRSAPISPVETAGKQVCPASGAQDVQAGRETVAAADQLSRGLWGWSGPDAAGVHAARPSGRASGSSGSSSRRRPRAVRPDVCRLLDLEDWAEDEAEGIEAGDAPDAGVPAVTAGGQHAAAAGGMGRAQSPPQGKERRAAVFGAPGGAAQGSKWAVGLRRRSSDDAAAEADVPAPPPTPVIDVRGAAPRANARRPPAVGWRGSSGRASAAGDESRLGLLAAEGRVAPSCAAEAPAVQQQWQQLEKAWQKSWWV